MRHEEFFVVLCVVDDDNNKLEEEERKYIMNVPSVLHRLLERLSLSLDRELRGFSPNFVIRIVIRLFHSNKRICCQEDTR